MGSICLEVKRKKTKDLCNLQAVHQLHVWVYIHKYTIIMWGLISPERGGVDELMLHPTYTTDITGCIEQGGCRVEDMNLAIMSGVVGIVRVIT